MDNKTLLIGEKADAMRRLAFGMSRMGISTQITPNTSSAMHDFAPDEVGAIVLGRQLPKDQCDSIAQHWRTLKPNVPIVRIQTPIGELIAETIKALAFKSSGYEPIAGSPSAHKRTVSFPTMVTSNIEVVFYHYTLMHRTRSYQVYRGEAVLSGQQIVHVPGKVFGYGGKRFAVVTINNFEKHVVFMH